MRRFLLLTAPAGLAAALAVGGPPAAAHAIVGNRFFPATIVTDDPGVADELALPTISSFKTGDDPAARELDVSGEYAKRLTEKLGVSFGETWTRVKSPDGGKAQGFQNLETTLKYQVLKNPASESIVSLGLSAEWGESGADQVGAERHSTFTPTVFFGKGAGGLPDSLAWARPLAVTGLVGYAIPSRARDAGDRNPRVIQTGLAIEYTLPYLAAHVKDYGFSTFVNHLTPLVEASFETPVANTDSHRTTGTINPGVIWSGRRFQFAAEATLPINRESGRGTGFVLQVHYYLDDLFPKSIGKPIW
jgi:hypothetical protein